MTVFTWHPPTAGLLVFEARMIFHFTEKLNRKLKIGPLTRVEAATGDHLRWYATLFRAPRCQFILTTNAASLFSVVLPGQGITDENLYLKDFFWCLRELLKEMDAEMIYDHFIAPHTSQIVLSKTTDRSVLGSMNDMIYQCKVEMEYKQLSPMDLSNSINQTPYSAIKYGHPKEVFMRMVQIGGNGWQ